MLYEIKMINSLSQPTLSVLSFTLSNWTAKNISGNAVTLGNATLLSSSRSYAPLKTAPTRLAVRNITWLQTMVSLVTANLLSQAAQKFPELYPQRQ